MSDRDVKNSFDNLFDYDKNGKLNTYEQMRQWDFVNNQHNYKGSTGGSSGSLFAGAISTVIGLFIIAIIFKLFNVDVESIPSGVLIFMLIIIGGIVSAVIALKK